MFLSDDVIDSKCPICLTRFHDPIILKCGHTFNRLCIQKIIDLSQSFNPRRPSLCPLCKYAFNPIESLIRNESLAKLCQSEVTFEWIFIDIALQKQKTNVLTFLKRVFDKRDVLQTNHIVFETDSTRTSFNSNIDFHELELKSMSNFNNVLQEACAHLEQRNGLRKMCILTDGLTKHSNLTKINSNIINKRFIIHIGDQNVAYVRRLADEINFHFEHFNEKTLDIYVEHFLKNF